MTSPEGEIFLGDLAYALRSVGASDRKTREAVAALLGFALMKKEPEPEPQPLPTDVQVPAPVGGAVRPPADSAAMERPDRDKMPASTRRRRRGQYAETVVDWVRPQVKFDITHEKASPAPAVSTRAGAGEAIWRDRSTEPEFLHTPLLVPKWTRGIVGEALKTLRGGSALDMYKVVEAVAREEDVGRLPALKIPTLARGCQVLCDVSHAMMPFTNDRILLLDAVRSVVGRERVKVFYFEDCPIYGVESSEDYRRTAYAPPLAGTPVLIVSDLGIADPPFSFRRSSPGEWRELVSLVRAAGCPPVAITPYPASRWPAALAGALPIICWDLGTTVADVRHARERD